MTAIPPEAIQAAADANDAWYGTDQDVRTPSAMHAITLAQVMLEAAAPLITAAERDRIRQAVEPMRDKSRALAAAQTAIELRLGFSAQDEVLTSVLNLLGGDR